MYSYIYSPNRYLLGYSFAPSIIFVTRNIVTNKIDTVHDSKNNNSLLELWLLLVKMKDDILSQFCWKVRKSSVNFLSGTQERKYIEQNKELKEMSLSGEHFCLHFPHCHLWVVIVGSGPKQQAPTVHVTCSLADAGIA